MVHVPEIEAVLEQMRHVLLKWHADDTLGEIAIVRSYHQLQIEERPRRKHKAVQRVAQAAAHVGNQLPNESVTNG